MHFKLPRQEPYTLAPLSRTSIYHLRAACAKIEEGETLRVGDRPECFSEEEKSGDNPRFTLFLELPLEIQAKIWHLSIEAEPRIVQLGSFKNEPNKLRQLNRQIKEDCLTLHGFVDLDPSRRRQEHNNNAIFHPTTDLLHLGPNSPWIWGPRSSTRRFAACGALDKIRCVAIMNPTSSLAAGIYFESFRKYPNLEVVFVIVKLSLRESTDGWRETEWVKFREGADDLPVTLVYNGRWYPDRLCNLFTQERREWMQGMMARGPNRVAPRVVFVEELRTWNEELQPRPDGIG
ncbi:hypothetical protein N431DRAFT_384940 [Stipitochalara longipes BDJ]|nr:hypothetical protein N431DRAFT_384940 [Stipitochalara longipes BDJ]